MNLSATYTEPTNRIKQRILKDGNLSNMACCCANWSEFVVEINEWGIDTLGGVEFDSLDEFQIQTLDLFIQAENGYIREEV
jgi:hypothetical protein